MNYEIGILLVLLLYLYVICVLISKCCHFQKSRVIKLKERKRERIIVNQVTTYCQSTIKVEYVSEVI